MKDVVVIIPVYKETLTDTEKVSFNRCLQVLGKYPIVLACPENLNLTEYAGKNLLFAPFDPSYFLSTKTYNKLMVSEEFYNRFVEYEYILIYQLDAFVFSDQLLEWCHKEYDYIGAPWLTAEGVPNSVGNGGFSLRKTKSFLKICSAFKRTAESYPYNEDGFWSTIAPQLSSFTCPSPKDALSFAFEEQPDKCFQLTQQTLPFGCHAWPHYMKFWSTWI